jgi:hypothetical protein
MEFKIFFTDNRITCLFANLPITLPIFEKKIISNPTQQVLVEKIVIGPITPKDPTIMTKNIPLNESFNPIYTTH